MEGGPPIFKQGFTCPALLLSIKINLRLQDFHLVSSVIPYNSAFNFNGTRLVQFRSSLLSESLLLSFPHPTEIFQFGWSRLPYGIPSLLLGGFAHSDSHGSLLTYSSPWRFAVRRVLLRHLVPRHPLCALFSLTFFSNYSLLI